MQLHHESFGSRERMRLLIKRAGMAGFVFFLAKGLLWLIVSGVLVWMGSDL
ncbi:MAG: hypothetical protein H6R47_355 [Proteobacteria bacterium]|nr:hypothetical protein [Pseudomonadota bacterium]